MKKGNSDTRNRYDESKYKILTLLYHSRNYLLPRQIAAMTGLTKAGVRNLLYRYTKFGYIWRRKTRYAGERGFMYRFLKRKGIEKLTGTDGLEVRMRIREITGNQVSLNKKIPIPHNILMEYRTLINR